MIPENRTPTHRAATERDRQRTATLNFAPMLAGKFSCKQEGGIEGAQASCAPLDDIVTLPKVPRRGRSEAGASP